MSKIKLSELTELTTPSSNTKNTYFIVTDTQTGTPVSKKMSAFTLDTLLDISQGQANLAFNHANSAFIQSNAAFIHANSGFDQSNAAFIHANSGFNQSNAAFIHANSGFNQSNSAFIQANAAFIQSNSAFIHANSSYESQNATGQYANAAFVRANNSLSANNGGTITGDVSITGNLTVTGLTTYVNTQTVLVADNILTLNAAVNQSSSPVSNAGVEIDRGNEANVYLLWNETSNKWTFTENGTNYDEIGSASTSSYANAAFLHANSAFDSSNISAGVNITQNNNIVSSFNHANASFDSANLISGVNFTQNNSIIASFDHANAAFAVANLINGVDATQNNSIVAAFIHANSGFDFANVAANLALSFGATTILEVLNSGTSAYRFTQYGSLDNPNVSTFSATTLGFKLDVSGHPFHIRTGDNTADFNTGLVHVSTTGTLSYDLDAQGKVSGTLFWRIPHNSVGNYKYRCANHPGAMLGDINVANTASIYLAHNT